MIPDILYQHTSCFSEFMHGHHGFRDGWNGVQTGQRPIREIVYHEECIYTALCPAIALQSIYLFQSHCIFFGPPTRSRIYMPSYIFTLDLYQIEMGVSLALRL